MGAGTAALLANALASKEDLMPLPRHLEESWSEEIDDDFVDDENEDPVDLDEETWGEDLPTRIRDGAGFF